MRCRTHLLNLFMDLTWVLTHWQVLIWSTWNIISCL